MYFKNTLFEIISSAHKSAKNKNVTENIWMPFTQI